MSKLKVRSGKGELTLQKSKALVGLRTAGEKPAEEQSFVKKEVHQNLGGFKIVSLDAEGETIDQQLDEVRTRDEVAVGTHVYYAEGSDKPLVATGEISITFEEGVDKEEQRIVLEEYHLEMVERRDPLQVIARVTENSPNPLKVAHLLQGISMVKLAEPDLDTLLDEYEYSEPNDDLVTQQWHLRNRGYIPGANYRLRQGADAKVFDAWRRLNGMGSDRVTVAIIDNGFDVNHPDLRTRLFRPFDLWTGSSNMTMGDPRFTHGTPCASVALAVSNGRGIVGAAPQSRFMPVNGTSFSNRATEQMFDYCTRNGADIISCSWGTTDPKFSLGSMKEQAIAKAARQGRNGKGCIILYAVGNDDKDYINFYAAHPDVIAVAASTSKDTHAPYSNRGREIDICAPSNGDWPILAARASWDTGLSWETGVYKYYRDGRDRGPHYKHFGGTSSSTPLVAGICALMLSANPDLTAREVKDILRSTADKIGSPSEYTNGRSLKYGYGRVNADKAVAEALRRRDRQTSSNVVSPAPQPSPSPSSPPSPTPPSRGSVAPKVSSGQGLFRFKVSAQPAQGWGVQVGVFGDYGNVLVQAEKLERQFSQPVIVNITELNGKTVYKIIVGAFGNFDEARRLNDRIKSELGLSTFPADLSKMG
ncbi:MAG: S8 family serine peptidase [Phaeodactylibacter sp.]|uniref:S8 family serine peptidase n=1 Tax=Phaeodactylibacter sp. TaxID=1940289 RepID=UPI0032EE12D6